LIWIAAVLLILAWPEDGGSLAVKTLNWGADPFTSLPRTPSPIGMGLGDDPDAVQSHDAEESAYYQMYNSSPWMRWRFWLRDLQDPFNPATERQVLVGLAILSALGIWRTEAGRE
jgi:hypothetical protein